MEIPFEGSRFYPGKELNQAIILLHAYTGSPMDVNLLARFLNRKGYTVFCPLFKGHGCPELEDLLSVNPHAWQMQTREWIHWMETHGYDRLMIFGLSLGGVFATWALTQADLTINGGGVFNSPVVTPDGINIESAFMHYAKTLINQKDPADWNQDRILREHQQQIQALEKFKQGFFKDLTLINRPFYIAQSGQDELIRPEDAYLLKEALIHAEVDFKWYPKNTHVITVNRDRQTFENDVLSFLTCI